MKVFVGIMTIALLSFGCATYPGRMLLPDNKDVGVSVNFSFNSKFVPGLVVDFRKRINEHFEGGASFMLGTDPFFPISYFSPYILAKTKVSDNSYLVESLSITSVIVPNIGNGGPRNFSFHFLPAIGVNYIGILPSSDEYSAGFEYDQSKKIYLLDGDTSPENVYGFTYKNLAINVSYLKSFSDRYVSGSFEYFIDNIFLSNIAYGSSN